MKKVLVPLLPIYTPTPTPSFLHKVSGEKKVEDEKWFLKKNNHQGHVKLLVTDFKF